jgi:hypothetical protein
MGVSGQHHAPAALLPPGKDPRYPLDRRLGGPQSRSGQEEKSFAPAGDRTPAPHIYIYIYTHTHTHTHTHIVYCSDQWGYVLSHGILAQLHYLLRNVHRCTAESSEYISILCFFRHLFSRLLFTCKGRPRFWTALQQAFPEFSHVLNFSWIMQLTYYFLSFCFRGWSSA